MKRTLGIAVLLATCSVGPLSGQDPSSRFNQVFDGAVLRDAKARELWTSARMQHWGAVQNPHHRGRSHRR